MKLEPAKQSDALICMKMIKDFYHIDNYPFNENKAMSCVKEMIDDNQLGRFWLILDENSKPLGYLILCFGFSFEYGGRDAFIDEFYLIPESRGQGIGTHTLKLLKEEAKKLGVKAIHLEVENTNNAGKSLYLKTGYKGNQRSLLTQIL